MYVNSRLCCLKAPRGATRPSNVTSASRRTYVQKSLQPSRTFAFSAQKSLPLVRPCHKRTQNLALSPTITSLASRKFATYASESFSDPDRPDLFYHLFEPPTPISETAPVFALSFISTPPHSVQSSAVIGWLPASAPGDTGEAGLNDFVENPSFREVLHEAIRSGLEDGVDDIQINGAIQTQQGWMHIHDSRNIPALGRIGDPDDILASVRVEDGKIMAETYQPMPSYRLCTADGVLQLTEGLAQRLKEVLEARVAEQR